MQGLKVLQLTISKISDTMPTTYQVATALSPLNVVARVDAFSVDLMWEVPEDLEARLGEVPYEIRSGRVPYTVITPDPRDASCTMMGYGKCINCLHILRAPFLGRVLTYPTSQESPPQPLISKRG